MAKRYEPRHPLIIFGDGMQARFITANAPVRDEQGIMVVPILLLPTANLKQVYKITDKDLTHRGVALEKKYPVNTLKWLNHSPRDSVLLILCTFDRQPTILTNMLQGMIEWDQERDKIEQTLKATTVVLQDELFSALATKHETDKKLAMTLKILRQKKVEDEEDEKGSESESESDS